MHDKFEKSSVTEIEETSELPKKLELGTGNLKKEGAWGVDHQKTDETDQLIDLKTDYWPLPSNHFTWIRAKDVLEHIENRFNFMEELYRIAKPGAKIIIKSPHFTSPDTASDLSHKDQGGFGINALSDFTENANFSFYSNASFEVVEKQIRFAPFRLQPHKHIGYFIANKIPRIYEHTVLQSLLPAKDVKWVLEVQKS